MSDIVSAINYSVAMGAAVANHSWGWTGARDANVDLLEVAFVRAGKAGQLIVTAAGNDITNTDTVPDWPTNIKIPQKISVAATNALDELSAYSNYAPGMLEVAAPGSDIYSTLPCIKGQYGDLSGTSMASPMVAGVASLIKSAFPALSPAQIRQRILLGVDKLTGLETAVASGGRLNAFKAVYQSKEDPLTNFTILSQWEGGSGMRLWPSGELDDGDYTGYPSDSWGKAGSWLNENRLSLAFMDIPRFFQPITEAVFSVSAGTCYSNDATERVELRVNARLTPDLILQSIDGPYGQPGAAMHRSLQAGKVIGSVKVAMPQGYGDLDRDLSIKVSEKGLLLLNRFASRGQPIVLNLGLSETSTPDLVYGHMDDESISFGIDRGPELQLVF